MKTDYLIIGSGIAGLNSALTLSELGKVTLITKNRLKDTATYYAQGGIAGVLDKNDSIKNHVSDTLIAGSNHNNKTAVKYMISNSGKAILRLQDLGVKFEKSGNSLKLTREGGHHKNRIAYTGDHTGKSIEETLIKRVIDESSIKILENAFALDLITEKGICIGATYIKEEKIHKINSSITVLATGGLGQIYKFTTNPKVATGDGIAMAVRAGCKLGNMEFIQFHPTALDKPLSPKFLISETLRGEGAILLNSKNERFMEKVHRLKELAPRDLVAKKIYEETKKGPVYLDIRGKSEDFYRKRFPKIYKKLISHQINMQKDLIPVVPAAHYMCGGIKTDINGQTNIKNLFAFGETAYTGVHGANRLASNSLLEGMVFSSKKIEKKPIIESNKIHKIIYKKNTTTEQRKIRKIKSEIREIMWKYAGIKRNIQNIKEIAIPLMERILDEVNEINKINEENTTVKNMAIVSLQILIAASKRTKSIGCHILE